jgi:hypothetical protein
MPQTKPNQSINQSINQTAIEANNKPCCQVIELYRLRFAMLHECDSLDAQYRVSFQSLSVSQGFALHSGSQFDDTKNVRFSNEKRKQNKQSDGNEIGVDAGSCL